MIDAETTEAFWDILHSNVAAQLEGENILATEVHAELMEFLAEQEITFPAIFEANTNYEIFDLFVDGGAIFITNSYPDMGPEQHTHPIFIECRKGGDVDSKILKAFPQLADYFTKSFCPDAQRAADAAEVETESAPARRFTQADADAELYQHVDMVTTDGAGTATGWILQSRAKVGNIINIGDDRDWRVTVAYDGFVITGAQMKQLPPTGYISETIH